MIQGLGLGLRLKYLDDLVAHPEPIQWLEVLADHFHDLDAPILAQVDALLAEYPCVLHGVNLSLASSDALNPDYLNLLERQVQRFNPVWISDHLCFSQVGNVFLHDLLPFPFTHALLDQIAFKIDFLQTKFKRPFLLENISSYLRLQGSEMVEAEFIARLANKTGCGILLDINNVVVTCHNHQESIAEYIAALPFERVMQLHMAGAIHKNDLLIDTHSQPIAEDVLALYRRIQIQHGPIPTCLEWDHDLPEFAVILAELKRLSFPRTRGGHYVHEQAFLQALQDQPEALAKINASPDFEKRLAIYKTSIVSTLQQALYKNFKPLEALIGKEAFQELCYRYANTHPSTDLNLNRYGADLHEFVKTAPFAEGLPYLSDFTQFCFVWKQVYLRSDGAITVLESHYPVYEIWQRCQPEFVGEQAIQNWQGPFVYAVYREDGRVKVDQANTHANPFV